MVCKVALYAPSNVSWQ